MLKKVLAGLLACVALSAFAAVEINKATEAELDSIKGVGPATSKLILSERKKSEFKDWEDLKSRVKGIGDARASKLSAEGLTVGGQAYRATTAKTPATATKEKAR
jgi:competence protein ComEA